MKFPTIHGLIERRILINYTIDPDVVRAMLPAPFRPLLHKGNAIGGICLIRLKNIKPKGLPDIIGINSENGAHRFAVEWDEAGVVKQGVYIPRRDTSSSINALAGGRVFPGSIIKLTLMRRSKTEIIKLASPAAMLRNCISWLLKLKLLMKNRFLVI